MIDYQNIQDFITTIPYEVEGIKSEEVRFETPPDTWELLGSLTDNRLKLTFAEYRTYTHFALGFYPYSGCELYKDDKGRFLLSYIELGGHFPFRRNFILGNNSKFVIEPISFQVQIDSQSEAEFIHNLEKFGLTKEVIKSDLSKYSCTISSDLNLNTSSMFVVSRSEIPYLKRVSFTFVANREKALEITEISQTYCA